MSENGKVVAQSRFVSALALIRLTTRIATKLSPGLNVRFDTGGWQMLRNASVTRNRITHPKHKEDLEISGDEVGNCVNAIFWLLELTAEAMQAANSALSRFNADFRYIFEQLKHDNPEVWAMYRAAGSRMD